MKFVPKATRREWHEKALDAAKGADLHSLLKLFVETKAMERLAELVRGASDDALEGVSHYATEPAAEILERIHPGLAARLWRAQGLRIVDAKKSKYYDAALANFERARDCYRQAGRATEWEESVRRVRAAHYRKTGFMRGFRPWPPARNAASSRPFWNWPRHDGAGGTRETRYEENRSSAEGGWVESRRSGRTYRRDHS